MRMVSLPNGSALRISVAEGVLGGIIWPAAADLCRHLLRNETKTFGSAMEHSEPPQAALELGSGTGIVGIYLAAISNRSVILTEHRPPLAAALSSVSYDVDGTLDYSLLEGSAIPKSDVLIKLLQKNVDQNMHLFEPMPSSSSTFLRKHPVVEELDWTKPDDAIRLLEKYDQEEGLPLLFASDVTYVASLHTPLAETIGILLNATKPDSKCWIAHQQRVMDFSGRDHHLTSFLDALNAEGLLASVYSDEDATTTGAESLSLLENEDTKQRLVKILEIRHSR